MPERPLVRICYVEDDEDIQRIVRMSLERIGKMTVEIVTDPMRAIEAMGAFKPDLVMLDWMMPGMDGPTLYRKMKELPATQALPARSPSLFRRKTCPSSSGRSGRSCPEVALYCLM